MTEREIRILKARLMPQVKKIRFNDGTDFRLEHGFPLELRTPQEVQLSAQALVKELSLSCWGAMPFLSQASLKKHLSEEAYEVAISAHKLTISASTVQGLRYAFRTLRQLAEPERGVEYFQCYILPRCEIHDSPSLRFRGIHLCWFPETPVWEMEKQIRLASYFKYNYVVIEPWGIFPYKSHPEFCHAEMKVKRKEFKRLIDLCHELGITPIPQINLLGHASWSRSVSGKHATLGGHPELQSLFEPDGWSWCLSNPHTRVYLTDMVDELMEFFGNPPFFHAGCDEAFNLATCSVCRKQDVTKLIADHITFFHDHLQERGARMLLWHDMMLDRKDARFNGYIVFGNEENGTGSKLGKMLPKDLILCDWQYGNPNPESKTEWPTSLALKHAGFDVLVCPWMEQDGALSLIRFSAERKLFGVLQTTWHRNRGIEMGRYYDYSAQAAWNPQFEENQIWGPERDGLFNRYVRHVDQDMGILSSYNFSGRDPWQIVPEGYPD